MARKTHLVALLVAVLNLFAPSLQGQVASFSAGGIGVSLQPTKGPEGHFSVGINERDLASESRIIPFSVFQAWNFSPETASTPPTQILALNERPIRLVGFMYPLEEGDSIKAFMLMASTQTCCFGPKPQFNQFVLAECATPVPFERLKPVMAEGKFIIEPRPDDGYIFRLETQSVQVLKESDVFSPARPQGSYARALSWEEFDALKPIIEAVLEREGSNSLSLFPASIAALIGSAVSLEGNILPDLTASDPRPLRAAKYPWDGCCQGIPPDIFQSILLDPASGTEFPSPWLRSGTVTGLLRMNSPERFRREGVFRLSEASFIRLSDQTVNGNLIPQTPPALHLAIQANDPGFVRLLLRGGTHPDTRDFTGRTALHEACRWGNLPLVDILLAGKAAINAFDKNHRTPLHEAAQSGNLALVERLATAGADLNLTDKTGFSPFHLAIAKGFSSGAVWLLEHGADPLKPTLAGFSPLHLAVMYNLPEMVHILVKKGADLQGKDSQGRTPLAHAAERRDERMIALLKTLGATK